MTGQEHGREAAHDAVPIQSALKRHAAQVQEWRITIHRQHRECEVQARQVAENVARIATKPHVLLEADDKKENECDEVDEQCKYLTDRHGIEKGKNVECQRIPRRVRFGEAHEAGVH